MAVKIRLARKGRKQMPIYDIVVADARAPRDGKFIEKIGQYNPHSTPATINLKSERAVYWLQVGAQPTDTTRKILSVNGVMLRHHLQIGVTKGAITQDDADNKFDAWMKEKEDARIAKIAKLNTSKDTKKAEALDAERKKKEEKLAAIQKAEADLIAAANAAEVAATNETSASEDTENAPVETETPAVEAETATPAAAEEVIEEPAVEEKAPEAAPSAEEATQEAAVEEKAPEEAQAPEASAE